MSVPKACGDCGVPCTGEHLRRGEAHRCPEHALAARRRRDAARPHRRARGYSRRFDELRAVLVARQPWCTACGATEDLTADHIVPLSRTVVTPITIDDLQVLCRRCNSSRGARGAAPSPPRRSVYEDRP